MRPVRNTLPDPAQGPPHAHAPIPGGRAGRLVAVVVSFDRLALLQQTVSALLAAPPSQLAALVVVDNASTDGTGAWLAGAAAGDGRLRVLTMPQNLGGAGGFEAGLRHAMAALAPDWLLVLDDDAQPLPGALAAFHALDLRGWDGVAGAVLAPDGRPCEPNRPTLDPFRRPCVLLRALAGQGREAFHLGPAAYRCPPDGAGALRPIDGASFVGLFLSRAAVARAGYPDGRLFLYADDALYTLGLTRAGLRLGFAPGVRFRHDTTTYRPNDLRIRPLWKAYYRHRNQILLYRMAAGWLFWPALALYLPRWVLRAAHHRGEAGRFLVLLALAVADGLAGRLTRPHPEVLARAASPRDGHTPGAP
jgi:GT2 family glycosyltransferase